MKQLHVLVLDGAMRSSVAITLDLLDTANGLRAAAGRPELFQVTVGGAIDGGRRSETDVVVVPGLGTATEQDLDARLRLRDAKDAEHALRDLGQGETEIAASCSSVFLLAQADLLHGRRATTSWWLAPLFRRRYPDVVLVPDELVVVDECAVTAGAAMAQTDLMLSVVGRHGGPRLARACARYLLLDERRSQAKYMALAYVAVTDGDVARARSWSLGHLHERPSVADVASAVGLSPRTFARRVQDATGLAPVVFLRRLRVERAVELLESTDDPVDAVARSVGYLDSTALRRAMRHELNMSPQAVRASRRRLRVD